MVGKPTITEYLEAGINGASLRQATIANNIANLNTPGYRRLAASFEKRLAEAIDAGQSVDLGELAKDVFRPNDTPVDANGNDVSLEVEIGEMGKNISMQKTYLRLLAKMYRQMELAIGTR